MFIHPPDPASPADDEAAGTDGGKYRVGITILEEHGAFSGMFEQVDRLVVLVRARHAGFEQ
jgi:hypothetical protein